MKYLWTAQKDKNMDLAPFRLMCIGGMIFGLMGAAVWIMIGIEMSKHEPPFIKMKREMAKTRRTRSILTNDK